MSNLELSTEVVNMLREQNEFLFEHLGKLRKENLKMHELLKNHKWGHKLVENDDKQVEYLTGCASYEAFIWLLVNIAPESALQCSGASPANQLMLTLMKVKLCIPDIYLKKLFQVHNVTDIYTVWLETLKEHLTKLLVWPEKKEKTADYSVAYINVRKLLQVAVVFTNTGTICYVSEAIATSSMALYDQEKFVENIDPGDRVVDLQSGIIYSAAKYSGRIRFNRTSKRSDDFLNLGNAKKVIASSVEKLKSFPVFSRDTCDFSNINSLVKISAALVNFHASKPKLK